MSGSVIIFSIYSHHLEDLKVLTIFITLHCNIMFTHEEKLNQHILTCDTYSNTVSIKTNLPINKDLIKVLNESVTIHDS
jgi:hypothetical protein